jgi:hypothetical protein
MLGAPLMQVDPMPAPPLTPNNNWSHMVLPFDKDKRGELLLKQNRVDKEHDRPVREILAWTIPRWEDIAGQLR